MEEKNELVQEPGHHGTDHDHNREGNAHAYGRALFLGGSEKDTKTQILGKHEVVDDHGPDQDGEEIPHIELLYIENRSPQGFAFRLDIAYGQDMGLILIQGLSEMQDDGFAVFRDRDILDHQLDAGILFLKYLVISLISGPGRIHRPGEDDRDALGILERDLFDELMLWTTSCQKEQDQNEQGNPTEIIPFVDLHCL